MTGHFPSLHRPVEHVEGLPGAISAGAVSNVQLFDLTAKVMRTVVIMASTDGGVYVMGGVGAGGRFQRRGGRQDSARLMPRHATTPSDVSNVVDVPVGSALLISADTTCGAVSQHLSSKVASPSSPSPSAAGLGYGDRPWRIQSLVAYRTSYNEVAVILARVPSTHSAAASNSPPGNAPEHCSELLFFYTQPLHSLSFFREARGGSEISTDSSTSKSVLAARVVRPKEHVMRLFALHVEPSPTGNRLNAPYNSNKQAHDDISEVPSAEEKTRRDEFASLGSLRYAHQSPPGLVVLCSSVVLCVPSKNYTASPSHMSPQSGHTNESQQMLRNQLSVLCLPMSAAERFKAADLVKPLTTDTTTTSACTADSLSGASGEGEGANQNKKKTHDSASESAGSCIAVGQGHRIVPLWLEIARFLREEETRGTGCGPVCSIAVTCTSPPEPRASPSSVGWMVALGCVDGTVVLASCPPCATSAPSEARRSSSSYPIQVIARLTGPASWLQFFLNSGWQGQHGGGGEGSNEVAAPRGTRPATIDKYFFKEVHTADYASHGHNFTNVGLFSPQLSLLGLDISGRALQWTRLTPLQQALADEGSACVESSTTKDETANDFSSTSLAHHNAYSPKMQYVWDAIEIDKTEEEDEQQPTATRRANDKLKNSDSNLGYREPSEGRPASIIDNGNTPAVSATLLPHPQDSSLPPAETPEKKRKDKSLVERWLNRKAGGGGGVLTSSTANNTSSASIASRHHQQQQHQQHSGSSISFSNTNNSANHQLGGAGGNGRIKTSSSGGGGSLAASVCCSQVDLCALDCGSASHNQQMRDGCGVGGGSTLSGGAALVVVCGEDGGGKGGGGNSTLSGTCTRRPCFEEATHVSRRSGNSNHNKSIHSATPHDAHLSNNKKRLKVLVDVEEDLTTSLYRVGTIIGRGPLAAAFVDHVYLSSHLCLDDIFRENDEEDDNRMYMCLIDSEDCANSSSQPQRTTTERTTSTSRGPQVLISTLGRVVAVCAPYMHTLEGRIGRSAEIQHVSAHGGGEGVVGASFPAAALLSAKGNGNASSSSSSSPLLSNPHQHSRSRTQLPAGCGSPNESTKHPFEVLGGSAAVNTMLPAQLSAQASSGGCGSFTTTGKKRGLLDESSSAGVSSITRRALASTCSKLSKCELYDGTIQECKETKRTPSPSPSPTPVLDASATPVLVAEGGIGSSSTMPLPISVEASCTCTRAAEGGPASPRSPTTSFFASPPPLPSPTQRKIAADNRPCFDESGCRQGPPHETCSPLLGATPPRSMTERFVEQTPAPLAVVDYFDVFSPMSYLGLADFSGVGDSVLVMASCDHVAVMPLHRRPSGSELARRVSILKSLFGIGQAKKR